MNVSTITPLSALLVIAGVEASAHVGLAAQAPPRVSRLGDHKVYGPGIVAATSQQVRFEVTRTACVIVLRVHPDGSIEPLLPRQAEQPTERAAGVHALDALPPTGADPGAARVLDPTLSQGALERAGQRVRPPAAGPDEPSPDAVWWVVVVSDVPTGLDELLANLEAFRERTFTSVEASVRALPRELVGQRAQQWAGYLAPVEP